jgi:glycosyltransferase involved in cell wall biosynthesis
MEILLTIAIPTVDNRKDVFNELYNELKRQCEPYGEQIEIIFLCDDKKITIGHKRQLLNEMAKGKYVVQWDDDDWIHPNGIDMIMEGIKSDVDVISYNYSCDIPLDDKVGFSRKVSIKNKNVVDFENKILNVTPDPKNPIKREIVNKIKFDDVSHSEEYLFKIDVGAHLKTEYKIEEDIYQILNRSGESYDFKTRYNLKPKKLM